MHQNLITQLPIQVMRGNAIPPNFGSLFGWWNFNVPSSLTMNGSAVMQINSLTNNGKNFTSGTTGTAPTLANNLNGRNTAAFVQANGMQMTLPAQNIFGSTGFCIFIIGQFATGSNQAFLSQQVGGTNGCFYIQRSFANALNFLTTTSGTGNVTASCGMTENAFQIIIANYNASNGNFFISRNNTSSGSNTNAPPLNSSGVNISMGSRGGNTFLSGYIGEIIIYNQSMSSTAITQVTNYMRNAWGYYGA